MSPLCKLVWLRKHEPEIFGKAAKFISFKEYVLFKLTGRYLVDHSIASATGLFDIHEFVWNKTALGMAGIRPDQLAEPCAVSYAIAGIGGNYKELAGIKDTVAFIVGGSDGAMANIGSDALKPGIASVTIGTSAAIRTVSSHAMTDKKQRLFCYAFDKENYICGGPLNNGGAVAKWFVEKVLGQQFETEDRYGDFIQKAFRESPVSGLIFIPHLMGERAVQWDPFAKAAFIGLTPAHTDKQLLVAIFEGITFALYEILLAMEETGMPVTQIIAGGGFTGSADWLQLLADIFDREIAVLDDADVSAKGAAIFGFRTLEVMNDFERAASAEMYYPDKQKHSLYCQYFDIYRSLYPSLKDSFFQLDELQAGQSDQPD
jgi:gluconokinase